MEQIKCKLQVVGQEHVLKFYDELSEEKRALLLAQIEAVDWESLGDISRNQILTLTGDPPKVITNSKSNDELLTELPDHIVEGTVSCDQEKLDAYRKLGMENISSGKVAALVLAGGQGTRLGVNYPKGMYDVGIGKSLFQLQAERILALPGAENIYWYIMTSDATMDKTKSFFADHNFFGLNKERVVFFEQYNISCLSFDGKVLLADKHKLSMSPNGNGGLFEALHNRNIISHMESNGVEYLHVFCVDNVLVRICDPAFMGYSISKQIEVGTKVVEKVSASESVGVVCNVGNSFKVIEYSEIPTNLAEKRDPKSGKLIFRAANICEHFFSVHFLKNVVTPDKKELTYHLAIKKIPHVDLESGEPVEPQQPNGIKLEKFIFDVFGLTDKFAVWEVVRQDEFSPLKNPITSDSNNPKTALAALERAYELGLLES